jgi:hypothetical protein
MRPRLLLGALAIAALGLCGVASADLVVYDNFDSAQVDTSLWTVDAGSTVSQSGSILTIGNGSGNSVWSGMHSTAQYDASAPNTYEFKYISGNAGANPYFGLIGDGPSGHNVFFRPPSTNQWKFGINGVAASGTLSAPVTQHPYDFVRTANTWQLWDAGSPGLGYTDRNLLYETATGTVVFDPGEKVSFWMAIRPAAGTLSLGYVAVNAVPEPSTVVLLTAGLVGLLAYAWRKRK